MKKIIKLLNQIIKNDYNKKILYFNSNNKNQFNKFRIKLINE